MSSQSRDQTQSHQSAGKSEADRVLWRKGEVKKSKRGVMGNFYFCMDISQGWSEGCEEHKSVGILVHWQRGMVTPSDFPIWCYLAGTRCAASPERCLLLAMALLNSSPQTWHRYRSHCVLPPMATAKPQGMNCWQARALGKGQPPVATHEWVIPPPLWTLATLSPSSLGHPCKADFGSQSARTGCWGSLPSDRTPCCHIAEGTARTSAVSPSSTRQRKLGEGWSTLLHATEFSCVQRETKKLRKSCWPQLLLLPPCKAVFLASPVRRAQAAVG